MDLKVIKGSDCSDIVEIEESGKAGVKIKNIIISEFLEQIMEDETFREFFHDLNNRAMMVKAIGIDAVLANFDRGEILESCSWGYVKDFFLDNIEEDVILEHIGWDKVKEYFADRFETKEESSNDINIGNEPSILEALDGNRRKNP